MGLINKNSYTNELVTEKVELPKGKHVYVKQASAKDWLSAFDKAGADATNLADYIMRIVLVSACDEEGKAVFDSIEDYENWPYAVVDAIATEAMKLNKTSLEEVEQVAKNS